MRPIVQGDNLAHYFDIIRLPVGYMNWPLVAMTKDLYLASVPNYGYNRDGSMRPCCECGGKSESYMVKHRIWAEVVPYHFYKELMCIKCLETRLGRRLRLDDFLESKPPINYGCFGFNCEIYCKLPS